MTSHLPFNFFSRRAFTLIEILAALAIMSVFTVVSLSSLTNVVDDARFSQTVREMEQIRNAFVGETQRLETGLRKNYGYLGDMGGMPTTSQGIAVLSTMPSSVSSWAINPLYGIGTGWKGPYLSNTFDQDFTRDAWGTSYVYTNSISGATGAATITSYGSDRVASGSGYAQDIVISVPAAVTTGTLLGYVVKASTDLIGADQVPFSSSAQVFLFYPNGSGNITSTIANISPPNSGKYTFTGVPLGYAAVKIFIPTSATATASNTLGPAIVEINKAATAATPVAPDATAIYGASSACTNDENYTYSSSTASVDFAASTFTFKVNFPNSYTWSNTFKHEQHNGAPINFFTISNAGAGTVSFGLSNSVIRTSATGGSAAIPTLNSSYTVSPYVISAGVNTFTFKYGTGWSSGPAVFYYQMGCKFIGIHPGL